MSRAKIKVGVLGATGMAGQRYVDLLKDHPFFEISFLAASKQSAGKTYGEAVLGRWHMTEALDERIASMEVYEISEVERAADTCRLVFSAVSSELAREYEEHYANHELAVVSNASAHRWTKDVPMIVPEVNNGHLKVIEAQRKRRSWKRALMVVKPNCSLQSYIMPLDALRRDYGLKRVIVTTLQSLSGAGHPGLSALDMVDNVVPYIGGEEEKSEKEPRKIFGKVDEGRIVEDESFSISAHCNRVNTLDGHLACVSVEFDVCPEEEAILDTWRSYQGYPQEAKLPSAPEYPVVYTAEVDRPQVRRDRDIARGMAASVGRLRSCPVFHWRFACLSHNTIRGAAGGGVLIAETLDAQGYL